MQNHEHPLASEAITPNTAPASTDAKAPYWAPQLTSHGQLEHVTTQSGSDGNGEGGGLGG